jgi:hypothetical protein
MRSSRLLNTKPQDDRLKNSSDGIFRIDPHAAFVALDGDENNTQESFPPLAKGVRGI